MTEYQLIAQELVQLALWIDLLGQSETLTRGQRLMVFERVQKTLDRVEKLL